MRSGTSSLSVLFLLLGASCSQIIGIGDYDKTDGEEETGGKAGSGGANGGSNAGGSGGTNRGGSGNTSGDAGAGAGGDAGEGGAGGEGGGATTGGGTGKGGSGGSATGGAIGTGGFDGGAGGAGNGGDGGIVGSGGKNTGGVGPTLGGSPGTGGAAGKGGAPPTSGGVAGKGGAPPTSGGVAGKGGSIGSGGAPSSGGKGGTGGTIGSGGTAGKGGSGGTAGKGGSGGTGGTPCTMQELLGNPNFDAAAIAPWAQLSDESYTMILTTANISAVTGYPVTPLSGTRAAVLGGVSTDSTDFDSDSWVYQDITIPARTTQLTFSCYRQIRTTEAPSDGYDFLYGSLFDTDEALRFFEWSDLNVTSSWTVVSTTVVDASPFAGNTYVMQFNGSYDESFPTWFYLDNCSVLATVCQ